MVSVSDRNEAKEYAKGQQERPRTRYRLSGGAVKRGYELLSDFSFSPSCMARVIDKGCRWDMVGIPQAGWIWKKENTS